MAGGVLSGKHEATIKMMPFDNEVRKKCGNCRYWVYKKKPEELTRMGECWRYPPIKVWQRDVSENIECGEWKGKDDPD